MDAAAPAITSAQTSPRPSPAAQEDLALLMGVTEAAQSPHELMLNLSVLLTRLSPPQLQGLAALMQAQSKRQQEQQAKLQIQGGASGTAGSNGTSPAHGAGAAQPSSGGFKPPQTRPPSDPLAAAAAVSNLAASSAAVAAQKQAMSVSPSTSSSSPATNPMRGSDNPPVSKEPPR
ncbi:hypothetical protein CBOM_04973 [Ceraceosorus bombacis]|uniref:Uncharacterized protein n=1 Tax=Ceraceosorus bombacis TaxID=401625 RepID=A0A0N7LA69_9BASI|nr:hypothetical protein CBOM_04973 [Ceraceosorus bombacis]